MIRFCKNDVANCDLETTKLTSFGRRILNSCAFFVPLLPQ